MHKESIYAMILGPNGTIMAEGKRQNKEVPAFLKPHQVDRVAVEASTCITLLYRKLTEEGYDVTVSHQRKTRYIAEARIKTDRVDSKALAELLRLNSLPESYMPPPEIAELREKVRRRAFLVRQRTKVKIRSTLTYEGVKPSNEYGRYTRRGAEWLRSLGLEPGDSYLRLMDPLKDEIRLLSLELKHLAEEDGEVRLPMTVPGK